MSQETSPESTTDIIGPTAHKPVTILEFIKDPRNMRYLLIFSAIINLLLLCGLITSGQKGTVTPTPIITVTTKPSPSPSPYVTEAPDEKTARLLECFKNCEARDFLNLVKTEAGTVTDFKITGDYIDIHNNTCYGFYEEISTPAKKFINYFEPSTCGSALYTMRGAEYRFADKLYVRLGNNWDSATITPALQTELVNAVDIILTQQSINSGYEQRGADKVRVLTAESQKVNKFNQLVKTKIILKVNERLQSVYLYQEEEKGFKQNIQYYDYGVSNKLTPPK